MRFVEVEREEEGRSLALLRRLGDPPVHPRQRPRREAVPRRADPVAVLLEPLREAEIGG